MTDITNSVPTTEEFEKLFINNTDLDVIQSHLSRFNPIKTMGMERMEIRHSAILGWLLNPQETHGLGDTFLRAFLAQALSGNSESMEPTALEVFQSDMMDAEVRREWRHIDLLVLSPRSGWVFIIENKFHSNQHGKQLERYMDIVTSSFMKGESYHNVRGVFLTLWDEKPEDDRYAPIKYEDICKLLKQTALSGKIPLTTEVETFLRHYLDVILEATGMSEEQQRMEKIARQLYRDNRRAMDFVLEHGKSTDFLMACENLIGEEVEFLDSIEIGQQKLVFNHRDSSILSFLPKSWYEALGEKSLRWHGCENWWAKFPVITWLQLHRDQEGGGGQIRLYAEVGPVDNHDFRRELIESIQSVAKEKNLTKIGFQKDAAAEGRKYSKFFKNNRFVVEDIQDHDQITHTIIRAVNSFRSEMEAVASILPQFKKYGSKEEQNA